MGDGEHQGGDTDGQKTQTKHGTVKLNEKKICNSFCEKNRRSSSSRKLCQWEVCIKGRAENAYALPTAKHLEVTCQAPCIEELQSLEENPSEGLTLKQGKISKGKINSQQKTKAHKKKIVKSIYQ